ncbi:MAG: hypothetical protein WC807_06470 [Hyphomicrobium sp.]
MQISLVSSGASSAYKYPIKLDNEFNVLIGCLSERWRMRQATRRSLIVMVLASCLLASKASAEGLETEPIIGGVPMRCWDFRGVIVRTTRMTDLGDVGRAWFIQRMPIIALDPDRLATLPPKLQIFFYGHECAHHVLGHYFNRTMASETEADCWSIKFGRERGFFTRPDIVSFAPFLATSRGSPFGHLPGPERANFLVSCFDNPERNEQQHALNR